MIKSAPTRTLLAEFRKQRGISAADLARSVGVSRQTIYAIEDGSYVPNTTIALQLARTLEVRVEDLFTLEEPDTPVGETVRAELLESHADTTEFGDLVRLCRVQERLVAVPVPSVQVYLPPADAIIHKGSGRAVSVKPFLSSEYDRRLLIAGCDPALSLLAEILTSSGIEIISIPSPSRKALQWLKQGRVHAAGSHLLDRNTGEYNVPIVERAFPKGSVRVVTFAVWPEGLVLQRGNPKSISSIADLQRKDLTIINREAGSGSRDLLDWGLRAAGIPSTNVKGYERIAHGHLPAAYAVANKDVDCCLASHSAARRFGLDFVPLALERFDLTFTQASLALPAAKAVFDVLNHSALRNKLRAMAGYETRQTGVVQL